MHTAIWIRVVSWFIIRPWSNHTPTTVLNRRELSLHRVSAMNILILGSLSLSLVFCPRSYFGLFPLCSPLPGSLATHALNGEMRHTGNLQADNGRQLLLLHKSFMSWISCTSLCSLPPTHASLIASWSRHSNTTRGELRRRKDKAWQGLCLTDLWLLFAK